MKKAILLVLLFCLMPFLHACSDKEKSPEDEIRQYIKTGVEAAENRSASDLSDLIHQGYLDDRKLDKLQLTKLARLYFFRHKNIFLFTKISEIKFHSTTEASVVLHVAMAGNVIADISMLSSLRAKIYRFELELFKQDQWLLQQASWQQANLADME